MTKPISGTKEWSVASVNCILGCPHRCRYCYARADALRRHQIARAEDWGTTYLRARPQEVRKRRQRVAGTAMFPTTHDIVPEFLDPCLRVIENLLAAGNRILIVSKPHFPCIREIIRRFPEFRQLILFRFTLGALDDQLLAYWEPGAPTSAERLACLEYAFRAGWETSVSAEPLLDSAHVFELVERAAPFVTNTIWIGKMNQARSRALDAKAAAIARIEAGQTAPKIREIYAGLNHHPKIRWKESYKRILGLPLAEEPGLDR